MHMKNNSYSEKTLSDYLSLLKVEAIEASKYSLTIPGSIAIGAAALDNNYNIYKGCYYPGSTGYTTVHAEHAALINAVSNGAKNILHITIYADTEKLDNPPTPCGSCLQAIADMTKNNNTRITSGCSSIYPQWVEYSISELLPKPWINPNQLT
jgi:cytidine deaminase